MLTLRRAGSVFIFYSHFGASVAGAGDFVIGAPGRDPGGVSNAGERYLIYGGAETLANFDRADGAKDGHVELVADEGVVYADEGSALDPDYEGAKYARGAAAAGAMPEE